MSGELRFDGRVVVVTGSGAGLGREYALLFGSRGAKVVVNDLGGGFHGEGKSQKAADIVVDEIRSKGGIAVANYDSVVDGEKIIQTAIDNFGRIDVLINNAGILRDRSIAKISNDDWNLINDIHLKASFKTVQAAWPYFKKQKYGKVIMTSSNSGVYGNFGQANYSAAKLGVVGLANTVAIEGKSSNICCNVIVPTAASRMTKDILPDVFYNELKPKLIAPVVMYLCHESCEDNGSIIESAAGWATKLEIIRGKGTLLRTSINDDVSPEYVRDVWSKINDMTNATHLNTISEASGSLFQTLEQLQSVPNENNTQNTSQVFSFGSKDLILYALGIGFGVRDEDNLRYLYENNSDFGPFPLFFVLPGLIESMTSSLVASALPHTSADLTKILHGEQYLEILDDLPCSGDLTSSGQVVDVMDKGSGAVVVTNYDSFDKSGKHLIKNQSSVFVVGAGGFGGKKTPNSNVIPTVPLPNRSPDSSITMKSSVDQAALYRLSGDLNPMHIDPSFSMIAGYKIPILHGLCSLGISVRAVLKKYANNDGTQFKAVKGRFTKPVIPGQTLKVDMWLNNKRVHFRTIVVETGDEVITGGFVDLKMVIQSNLTSALQSDAIFNAIKDRVAADPGKAKTVNGVFLYKLTENGKVVKEWTLDLKNCKVYEGAPDGVKADTTLTVAETDMIDIALGKLNPQAAFMKGKLKIAGNIMLTQKLMPLLKTEAKL